MARSRVALDVVAGASAKNLTASLRLRRRIYRGDPCWVPQLDSQYRRAHSNTHPYRARGSMELFVAYLDGRPVACATAFHDAVSAEALGSGSAYFSQFESVDDVAIAERLFEAIAAWAMSRGAAELVGPMSPRMSDPRGIRIQGEGAPAFGMSYNPGYYDRLLGDLEFRKATDLFEFVLPGRSSHPRIDRIADLVQQRFPPLRVRPLDVAGLDDEFRLIAKIYNEAWKSNWGFIPLDPDDLIYATRGLRRFLRPENGAVAELDGMPIGFSMVVPDLNGPIKAIGGKLLPFGWMRFPGLVARERAFRALFIGVLPAYRKAGIETLLLRAGLALDPARVHLGWVVESNTSWRTEIERLAGGAARQQRYRIYRRPVQPDARR